MASLREVTPYLSLGWQLAGTTAVPPLIGYVVDRGLGTLPWGVLVGCLLGLAAAGVQLKRLQDDFGR
jgi:F0F1-type ATP synthase assembly protein I